MSSDKKKIILIITIMVVMDEEQYLEYIRRLRISGNQTAINVKIADLTNNSDYTRLGADSPKDLSEKDRKRRFKYQQALKLLGA